MKEIIYPICDGDSEIIINKLAADRPKSEHLSIWLCQGIKDSDGCYDTSYHVSTVGDELDELINHLISIRDRKTFILADLNK